MASSQQSPLGIGIVGMGIMGQTHARAWNAAAAAGYPCRVVAVADRNLASLTGQTTQAGNLEAQHTPERLFDPAVVRTTSRLDELLANADVHVVSICTHTDTHVEIALAALAAGKHILLEKPVALRSVDVQRVADAAKASGRACMVAMCMRFWPAWAWLKGRIADGSAGAVTTAFFERLASPPGWSADFYHNSARSGGAAVDLHIHDADFVRHCFGEPDTVTAIGTLHNLTSTYQFATVRHVVARGGWDYSRTFPFRMRYLVNFERGTADFDISRTPQLWWHADGKTETIDVGPLTGYDMEVRHLCDHLRKGTPLLANVSDAVLTAQLLEREITMLQPTQLSLPMA